MDNRPTMDQFHELQKIFTDMKVRNIYMDEIFVVSSIIDKLLNTCTNVETSNSCKRFEQPRSSFYKQRKSY